jgi:hypothetical protein
MKLGDILPMCRPAGGVSGCPHDGLGCPWGGRCNRPANATRYGPNVDEVWCVKRESKRVSQKDSSNG